MAIDEKMIQELPLVTLLAISFNHEKFLIQTLDSILAQDYPNIELIIIDAASSDSSVSLIKSWVEGKKLPIQTIFQRVTKPITQNANEGLALASGKYFQIISCDDILEPSKISKQVEVFLTSDDSLAVVYCDAIKIDENGVSLKEPSFFEERAWQMESQLPSGCIFPMLLQDYFIVAPTVLVDTQKVRDLGGYNSNSIMEDLDIFLRLSQHFSFKGIYYKGVKYRILQSSLLRSTSVSNRQINRLMLYSNFIGQKGDWDRFIAHQYLLIRKSDSIIFRFLFYLNRLLIKVLLKKVAQLKEIEHP